MIDDVCQRYPQKMQKESSSSQKFFATNGLPNIKSCPEHGFLSIPVQTHKIRPCKIADSAWATFSGRQSHTAALLLPFLNSTLCNLPARMPMHGGTALACPIFTLSMALLYEGFPWTPPPCQCMGVRRQHAQFLLS